MRKFELYFAKVGVILGLSVLLAVPVSSQINPPERGFISSTSAETWEEGLIIGNGTIGGNILSRPLEETIIFSHERLFMPKIGTPVAPADFSHRLFEIRNLIERELYQQALVLTYELAGKRRHLRTHEAFEKRRFMWRDPFVPAFELNLKMEQEGKIRNYMRSVDFQTGVATVRWEDDRGIFERKMFVSRADGLAVLQISGPTGAVNCELSLNTRKPSDKLNALELTRSHEAFETGVSEVQIKVEDDAVTYTKSFTKAYPGSIHRLEGVARIIDNDGQQKENTESIIISKAGKVLIMIDLDVLYDPDISKIDDMKRNMSGLTSGYDELLKRHAAIHGEMFNRMKIDLGGDKEDHTLTTEELIATSSNENMNIALLEKQFDAGRYNIISSIGELPPTLQGIWGGTYRPNWASDFTHNGNLPVAVSSLLMGNKPELMLAYTSYIESIVPYMKVNAKHIFNARGVVLPHHTTTHGYDYALIRGFAGGLWLSGAPWAAHFFYDYYLYTGDREFLAEHALPFMEEVALFYEDYLFEDKNGKYVFSPAVSPENTPGNINSECTFNPTMDVAAAKQLLTNTIAASKELGVNGDKISLWTSMLDRMPEYMIDENGIIREWLTPKLENNDDHRHSSQLYPLFYGMPDEIKNSPELQEAFRKSIDYKMNRHWRSNVSGFMSFGLVQLGQAAASLGEGELVYECLQHLVNRYWLNNLASMHNHRSVFNMDISGGMPALMIQMLVASDPGEISLLPALPKHFDKGTIEGVLCRGQIEVKSLSWEGNSVTVSLKSQKDQQVNLVLPSAIKDIEVADGNSRIEETGETYSRKVSLKKDDLVTLNLVLL